MFQFKRLVLKFLSSHVGGKALLRCVCVACFLCCADVHAQQQPCFRQAGEQGIQACVALARSVIGDKSLLQALGHKLEVAGRYQAAGTVYKTAVATHANDRQLLQGLIRARSERNALKFLAGLEDKPQADQSTCWTARWLPAVKACRSEIAADPNNARLYERLADVLRSVGRADDALLAYAKSLRLAPDNVMAKRKQNALAALTDGTIPAPESVSLAALASNTPTSRSSNGESNQRTAETPRVTSSSATDQASTAPDASPQNAKRKKPETVEKLQLLQELFAQGLLDKAEYRQRREDILESAFAKPAGGEVKVALAATAPSFRSAPAADVPATAASGRYRALVIGNNRYAEFPKLQTPVADAIAVAKLLERDYGFNVTRLTNASRYKVLKALAQLRKELTAEDNLLVYYAGHGYLDEATRRGYWLPIDAERDNTANWISTDDITDTLAGVAAKHAIVIADSCFSGTLTRATPAFNRDERNALLQRLASKRSRTVLTSGGLEPVLDDGDGKHSIFARVFLDILTENQGVLEAERLFVSLRDRVALNADQTPQYAPIRKAGHAGGDFIFVRQ
ncbi:MAG: caspase family protein [Pseudomonadales bacterium]